MESGATADVRRLVVVVEENCFKGRVDPWKLSTAPAFKCLL